MADGQNIDFPSWSWRNVCARRLARHALLEPRHTAQPAAIVTTLCAVHAQVLSAAELAIGLRATALSRTAVQDALWRERSLIKTFGPRGTVHLLATADLPAWIGALSAMPLAPLGHAPAVRLTPLQTDSVVDAIGRALEDQELTLEELDAAVIARAGGWAGERVMPAFGTLWPRWRQALATAAHRGMLCFGPNRGKTVTYTSPHRWLPTFRPLEGEAALVALVHRYLYAYGPATPEHFAQWLRAPHAWARRLFASLGQQLRPLHVAGTRAWVSADDGEASPAPPASVRLLPYFDAYVVGCQPRALLFPGRASTRALTPSGQAGNYPVLLIDGMVAGVWHVRRTGRRAAITVEPFDALSAAQDRALRDQVERIGAMLGAQPSLTVGTVTAGAHA